MHGRSLRHLRRTGAFLAAALLLVLGVLSFLNRSSTLHGEDGITWREGSGGLEAIRVEPAGPGEQAGLRTGDRLVSIEGIPVQKRGEIRDLLWGRGGVPTLYSLSRAEGPEVIRVTPRLSGEENRVFYYLCLVGFLTLGAGCLIFSRLPGGPTALLLLTLLGAFYAVLVFSPSGRGGTLDWSFYWGDLLGRLLVPALLFHLILRIADTEKPGWTDRVGPWCLYGAAGALLALNLYLIPLRGALQYSNPAAVIAWKDRLEILHLSLGSTAAVVLLLVRLWTTTRARVRWRLRWIAFSGAAGLLPPILLHLLPNALDVEGGAVAELSVLPLAFIPLGFAAALLQDRTVDLDRSLRGGIHLALEAAVLVGLGLIVSYGWGRFAPEGPIRGIWGEVILPLGVGGLGALLIHRPLGRGVRRLLGGGAPEVTRSLHDFQADLNGEVRLEALARNWIGRVKRTLEVEPAFLFAREGMTTVFRAQGHEPGTSSPPPQTLPLERKDLTSLKGREAVLLAHEADQFSAALIKPVLDSGCRYLFPLSVQGELNAFLLVGPHRDGSPLESNELEILAAVSAQASRAVDGARLYREIEERIERERGLRAQSQGILEASRVGILLTDDAGRVTAANRAALEILGQKSLEAEPLDRVLPRGLLLLLDRKSSGRSKVGEEGRVFRYSLGTADGRCRVLNATRAPLSGETGPGQVYTLDDVTEEVDREQKMLRQDHLASMGLLASKIAHEVNTPLTGIASYAQLLMSRMKTRLPEMDLLRRIENQAFRAAGIASSVLNFARRKEGETAQLVEPGAMIAECLTLFEPHLKGRRIRVATERAANLPRVRGHRGRLGQALMNLLLNAAEALPSGGEVRIHLSEESGYLKIQVADDGVGIDPELLPRVFEPFVSSRSDGKGTGLGLAVVQEVVREHRGRVEVESEPGRGSTFTLLLPGESEMPAKVARGA